jgi:hypothetical protein
MWALARLIPLIYSLVSVARPTMGIPWSRLPVALFAGAVCFAILFTGLGFLITALYLSLEQPLGPPLAALIVGLVLLPIAAIIGVLVYRYMNKSDDDDDGLDIGELIDEAHRSVGAAEDWISRRPLKATGAAVALGMLATFLLTRGRR